MLFLLSPCSGLSLSLCVSLYFLFHPFYFSSNIADPYSIHPQRLNYRVSKRCVPKLHRPMTSAQEKTTLPCFYYTYPCSLSPPPHFPEFPWCRPVLKYVELVPSGNAPVNYITGWRLPKSLSTCVVCRRSSSSSSGRCVWGGEGRDQVAPERELTTHLRRVGAAVLPPFPHCLCASSCCGTS